MTTATDMPRLRLTDCVFTRGSAANIPIRLIWP